MYNIDTSFFKMLRVHEKLSAPREEKGVAQWDDLCYK